MIGKTFTYKDFNGTEVTETFWFHLSKTRIVELERAFPGGLVAAAKMLGETKNPIEIVPIIQKIAEYAVGRRSDDGRRFMQDSSIVADFMYSNAWDVFLFEYIQDSKNAAEWFNGIMPEDLAGKQADLQARLEAGENIEKLKGQGLSHAFVDEAVKSLTEPDKVIPFPGLEGTGHKVTLDEPERDLTDWRSFSKDELMNMPGRLFQGLIDAIPGKGIPKELLNIAMARRAAKIDS